MNGIFCLLMLASCGYALLSGRAGGAAEALLASGEEGIRLAVELTGAMMIWCGLTEILRRSGDAARLGTCLRRLLRPLFPGLTDDAAWGAISTNLAANLLGLGNAATPAGIEAAKCLAQLGDVGLRSLAMLLALNNAGLQLAPTTVISLRAAAGSADPAGIWLPALIASGVSTVVAAILMCIIQRRGRKHGGDAAGGDSRSGHPAGDVRRDGRV